LIYLFGQRSPMARSAAEILIAVGVVAALGAAVTGYTDWGDTVDRERRIGLSHGLLNLIATLLYAVSLVLRLTTPGQGAGISDSCSHAGGPLHEGTIEDNIVICPWHASRFDLRTGAVRGGPATVSQVRYDARIAEGRVEVRRSPASLQPN